MRNLALTCVCLVTLVACQTKTVYVDRIKEVPINTPPQLMKQCTISQRDGEKVIDYIVSEKRLRNDLAICNLIIKQRNENEMATKVIQK